MISQENMHNSQKSEDTAPETHRVLIVDDEPAICFAYRKLLEAERFYFDVCDSVEAAISYLKTNDYFAVISDVRFAGSGNEDGVHFISVVRREQPEAKVILVTGYGSDELKNTMLALGAAHYFEKPVKPSLILSLLRKLHLVAHECEENENLENGSLVRSHVLSCLIVAGLVVLPLTSRAALECSVNERVDKVEVACTDLSTLPAGSAESIFSKDAGAPSALERTSATSQESQVESPQAASVSAAIPAAQFTNDDTRTSQIKNRRPQESEKVAAKNSRNLLIAERIGK